MRRIYLDKPLTIGASFALEAPTFHYVARVLRCREGELLKLFNGDGNDYIANLTLEGKKQAFITVERMEKNDCESPVKTVLIQGLSKGERMDMVMQKSVELGVNEIIPVHTEFCSVKLDDKRLKKKMQHWQSIIISACEQSERAVLPILHPLQPLSDVIDELEADCKWILHPRMKENSSTIFSSPSRVAILIGPEGGFSDREVEKAVQQDFYPKQFGRRILRTETAAMAALSVCQQLWGDWNV